MINDKILVANNTASAAEGKKNTNNHNNNEDMQVENGDINHHIVEVLPINQAFMNPASRLGMMLKEKKFDVNGLTNMA